MAESRFAEIEADGEIANHDSDSKHSTTKIKITAELGLTGFINAGVKFILDHVTSEKKATNTGYQSAATNTGDRSAATNTGDRSAAEVSGSDSIACGLGWKCKARGSLGCWIVLAERDDEGKIITVKSATIDGENIKADVWYTLENGNFVEV